MTLSLTDNGSAKKRIQNFFLALTIPLILLILWEWSVAAEWVPNTLIASPSQVVVDFLELLFSGKLIIHSLVSLYRLIFGLILGVTLGLITGTIVGVSKLGERLIAPTLSLLAPIPPIAWIPLLIILFGIGEASKIALIIIASALVVHLNTVQGIRSTDEKLIDIARVYKKSNSQLITRVLLPAAMPQIFTGLRLALGLGWILLVAAEVIASSRGLGWLIWDARNFSRPDDMFVGIITIGILGKLSDMALVAIERHFTAWRRVFSGK